jgi:N-acetylglucosamine kinase-like BadF-type ATPase
MFLIVESGSTKADWVAVKPSGDASFYHTRGLNPATQNSFFDLKQDEKLLESIIQAQFIFFYGAGVINEVAKDKIKTWLQASGAIGTIEVNSDLLAACRACSGKSSGIVGILGTGSNSCIYDGNCIIDIIPSLGYILGDEGSGAHIGKEILSAYFCRKMPEKVQNDFENQYELTRDDVINQIYQQHAGSRYIASFASFLGKTEEDWSASILTKVFRAFIEYRIVTLKNYRSYPIHFAGSIAYYHRSHLEMVLKEYGLAVGNIVQQPIHTLIDYHFKQIYK